MSAKPPFQIAGAVTALTAFCLMCLAVGAQPAQQHTCRRLPSLKLVFGGRTYQVEAVEAAGSVLVPEKTLQITGAVVKQVGERKSTITLGDRTLHLTLGRPEVTVVQGDQSTEATWTLCPRPLGGITYVPLRAAAEALGLTVTYRDGTVTLKLSEQTAAAEPLDCPATRVEAALGVTVVRGAVSSPFGTGVGVLAVTEGGRGAELGLKPKDVILTCNGKPTTCPLDLDAIIAEAKAADQWVCSLEVVSDGRKVTLEKPPAPAE